MKKIVFIAITALALSGMKAQTAAASYALVYSENEKALIHENSQKHNDHRILIKSLPSASEDNIPVKLTLKRGSYSILKSPELAIPGRYRVYLEDTRSKKNYNLNSSEAYSFIVSRKDNDRFILHVNKALPTRYSACR